MNIPNVLTMSRIGLSAVLVYLLAVPFKGCFVLAWILFILAGITDALDGYLARNVYGTSAFGKLMDPLADKVMVCAALIGFVGLRLPGYSRALVPAWMVVLIIAREFLVTGLRLLAANKGRVISAGRWGKHKTIWQIVAIALILLGLALRYDIYGAGDPLFLEALTRQLHYTTYAVMLLVVFITVVSGVVYMKEHADLLKG